MSALKLLALDAEDLAVVSAHVQDAVLKVGDVSWRPKERRLVVALNRFVWEGVGAGRKHGFERRRACLHFARVDAVKATRIRPDLADTVLELLAIRFEETNAPGGTVELLFAGGGTIRLEVECIEAGLADLGAAWSTEKMPAHEG